MVDFASKNERVSQRVKVRLTREGWQFLLMLSFIVFAAIIQNINLLILISGPSLVCSCCSGVYQSEPWLD